MAMTRALRCPLTREELEIKHTAFVQASAALQKKKQDWKDKSSLHRAEVKEAEERMRELARDCQDKSETRTVQCQELHDKTKGEVRVIRLDTEEVIDSRPMTEEERAGHGLPPAAKNVPKSKSKK